MFDGASRLLSFACDATADFCSFYKAICQLDTNMTWTVAFHKLSSSTAFIGHFVAADVLVETDTASYNLWNHSAKVRKPRQKKPNSDTEHGGNSVHVDSLLPLGDQDAAAPLGDHEEYNGWDVADIDEHAADQDEANASESEAEDDFSWETWFEDACSRVHGHLDSPSADGGKGADADDGGQQPPQAGEVDFLPHFQAFCESCNSQVRS